MRKTQKEFDVIPMLSPSTMTKLVLLLGLMVTTGCSTVLGALNTQRAGLRGTGDIGVTAYLDSMADDKYEAHATEIAAITTRLQAFMGEGEVKELIYPKLVEAVKGIVPQDYRNIANLVLDAVQRTSADVDVEQAIGDENVARINAVLEGVAAGLRLYRAGHRPVDVADEAAAEASPATPPLDALGTIRDAATGDGEMPPDEDMDVQPGDGSDG